MLKRNLGSAMRATTAVARRHELLLRAMAHVAARAGSSFQRERAIARAGLGRAVGFQLD